MRPTTLSEVGPRENNEDAAFASPRLVAVTDGVGGAVAGELASLLAINAMTALDKRRLQRSLALELADAVSDANAVIELATEYDPRVAGMATTLTAVALSNEGEYLVANVGDSRTYLLRDHWLRRLTRDHSLVQLLIDRGAITEDDARRHPQRSVVLEALDGIRRALPEIERHDAQAGDRLLLCSDGLSDYVGDEQIAEALAAPEAEAAARELTRLALEHGGRDNVTVVVADVVAPTDTREGWLDAIPVADSTA
ncbi:MAG TPA: protein phosphatase 2C domain-containing protein [Solirubrobacteraceae bacterium]|nr:protein phosphatase 2C domain-containing protein [Solirubrobacteraceae bacterium]